MAFNWKILAAAVVGVGLTVAPAAAQSYPSRIVTLVVPFSPGGPSDAIARLVADSMSKTLGKQIIVENVAGAGGTLGAARLAKAEPDGHTILIHHIALAAGASLYANLPYDTATGLEPLGLVNTGPMVLASRKDFAADDAKSLLQRMKADGPKLTLAHAGVGSNAHLCALLLQQAIGQSFNLVGYKGTGPAMNDLIGGQVDLLCDQSTNAVPPIASKTIKGFAVSSKVRLPALKDLPTLDEAGLKGFEFVVWHGLYAPKGTPKDIVAKLHDALQIALKEPTILARFDQVGTTAFPDAERSVEAHQKRFQDEIAKWKRVIAESGVQPQK